MPVDLENYVLKPLFSFAGQGVVIDVTPADIEKVKDPENWILQRKVKYADVIETPDIPAKAEIRIFYFWKDDECRNQAFRRKSDPQRDTNRCNGHTYRKLSTNIPGGGLQISTAGGKPGQLWLRHCSGGPQR